MVILAIPAASVFYAMLAGSQAQAVAQVFETANWVFNLAAGVVIAIALVRFWLTRRKAVDERALDRSLATMLFGFDLLIISIAFQIAAITPVVGLLFIAGALAWIVFWLPPARRAIVTESSVVIERDPATVFAFVTNDVNQPRYVAIVESVEKITTGPIGPGTQFRGLVRLGPNKTWEGTSEVIHYEPSSRVTSRTIAITPNLEVLTFEPVARGTLLRHRFESEIRYNQALLGGVFLRGAQKQRLLAMRKAAWDKLKQILETSEFDR